MVAEETYRNVQSQIPPVNQSIIVSGESGAGKVRGNKHANINTLLILLWSAQGALRWLFRISHESSVLSELRKTCLILTVGQFGIKCQVAHDGGLWHFRSVLDLSLFWQKKP